jgi:hypothetical protein
MKVTTLFFFFFRAFSENLNFLPIRRHAKPVQEVSLPMTTTAADSHIRIVRMASGVSRWQRCISSCCDKDSYFFAVAFYAKPGNNQHPDCNAVNLRTVLFRAYDNR